MTETEYFRRLFLPKCIISCSVDVLTWVMTQDMEFHYCNRRHHLKMTRSERDILLIKHFPHLKKKISFHFLTLHLSPSICYLPRLAFRFLWQPLRPRSALSTLRLHAHVFFFTSFKIPDCPQFVHLAARHETVYELVFSLSPPLALSFCSLRQ